MSGFCFLFFVFCLDQNALPNEGDFPAKALPGVAFLVHSDFSVSSSNYTKTT